MTKSQITYSEYLELTGLLLIGRKHMEAVGDVERAAAGLLGVDAEIEDYFGHVSDAVSSNYSAAELLRKLKVTVKPRTSKGF